MIPTNLLIVLRSLRRNTAFSLLNILGLAVGLAASVLIFLVIRWETSYDGYHKNKDRVFRVTTTVVNKSNREVTDRHAYAPISLGDVVQQDVSGVEKVAAMLTYPYWQAHIPGKNGMDENIFLEKELCSAEPTLFEMIDVKWLDGNETRMNDPNMAVISKSIAEKWFGTWHGAVGRTVLMGSARVPYTVTGVYQDLPGNTDIPLGLVLSYSTLRTQAPDFFTYADRWHYPARHSELFVLLRPGRDRLQVEGEMAGVVRKYYNEDQVSFKTTSKLGLQPIPEMHLDERFETIKGDALSKKVLWSLGAIGVFLVLVACINFINLATAQSVSRSKEVGVRKVLGSNRWQLLRRFMAETAVITGVALVIACGLVQLALPWLREVMGKPIVLDWLHSPALLLFLLLTGVAVTLLAGFYPAVVLSGFNVIEAIKSKISTRTIGGLSLRRSLVVFQFVIAQLLITGTVVVLLQLNYFRTRPMGFDQSAVAMLELPGNIRFVQQQPYLKKTLEAIPGVESASFSNQGASGGEYWREQAFWFDGSPAVQDFKVYTQIAEPDFIKTMGISVVAGVLPDTNRREVMVNETLVKRLGLASPMAALGRRVAIGADTNVYRVTGVVRDYHFQSLREAIGPMVFRPEGGGYNFLALRIRPDAVKTTIARVQKAFAGVYPNYLFDCRWMDEQIAHFYITEETTASLVKAFAVLAIVISCIGLYGLVAFLAVSKMKEVGIRKVLGASVGSIVYLFSREFTVLTGLAFLISTPIGYAVMTRWLAGFYYHVSLGWGVFALTLGLSLGIAWGTVGYRALRAAWVNPVRALRSE